VQARQDGIMLAIKVQRMRYYMFPMEEDCHVYIRRCHKLTYNINLPFFSLHLPPWLYSLWGIDIITNMMLKGTSDHEYTLVAIDYFTKWIEAVSYAKTMSKYVPKFLINDIKYRCGVPHELIND